MSEYQEPQKAGSTSKQDSKKQENQSADRQSSQKQNDSTSAFHPIAIGFVENSPEDITQRKSQGIVDNRPEAITQRTLQELANNSPQAIAQRKLQELADNSPQAQKAAQLRELANNSPQAIAQRKLQELANNSPQAIAQRKLQELANNSPQVKRAAQFQAMMNGRSQIGQYIGSQETTSTSQGAIQKMEDSSLKKKEEEKIQLKKGDGEGQTSSGSTSSGAMPGAVKEKMENAFQTDFSNVKIHDNSTKSTEMGAKAYAQGSDLHFAPGQYNPDTQKGQELLGHELTHVVQQRQGRVQATTQAKGTPVNDDPALEKEADEMGEKAANSNYIPEKYNRSTNEVNSTGQSPVQRKEEEKSGLNTVIFNPKGEVNLYHEATEESKIISSFNDPIKVLGLYYPNDQWASVILKVEGKFMSGYVQREFLVHNMLDEVVVEAEKPTLNRYDAMFGSCNLRSEINGAEDGSPLKIGDRVYLISIPEPTWYYVMTDQKEYGYVPINMVNGRMPDPGAKLYKIKSGDTVEKIIKKHYRGFKKGKDRRYFANALMYVNNSENSSEKGIYKDGGFSFKHVYSDYNQFQVKEDLYIWIPSQGYADNLVGQIDSGSITHEAKEYTKDKLLDPVIALVDQWWPEGFGINLEGGIGATFGYPIGVDLDTMTHFYRKDKDTIALRKSAKAQAGLDTGVGAGFYLGSKGSYGVGGEAGANAEVKAGLFNLLEYEFPFKEDFAVLSLLSTMKGGESMANMAVTSLLDMFMTLGISPMRYLKKSKQAIGVRAQADALAQGGLRTGQKNQRYAKNYGKDNSAPEDAASRPSNFLLKKLNASVGGMLAVEGNIGVEMDVTEYEKDAKTGMREPVAANAELFIEGKGIATAKSSIPLLPNITVDPGMGLKVQYKIDSKKGEWKYQGFAMYLTSGEMDQYKGPASEVEVSIGRSDAKGWDAEKLTDYFREIKIKKRMMVSLPLLKKYEGLVNMQNATKRLMKQQYGGFGGGLSSYLTLSFDLKKSDMAQLFKAAISLLKGTKITKVFSYFDDFLATGKVTKELQAVLKILFSEEVLADAEWYSIAEAGFAGGAKASAGAKVRLDFNASGGITYTTDVKKEIMELMQQENKLELISSLINEQLPGESKK